MPQFSVITPTWNRLDGRLERCVNSIASQTYRDYEHIVVDDGSTDGTWSWLESLVLGGWNVTPVRVEHQGRVIARNRGTEKATGEWMCHLDSDDAYDPMYLETLAWYIEQEPEVNLWVVGAVVHGVKSDGPKEKYGGQQVPIWTKLRKPWTPPVDSDGRHMVFDSGHVGTGSFVYRRKCLEVTGLLPDWRNHNEIASGMNEWLDLKPGDPFYDRWSPKWKLVGNPYGDDHALFCKLCRHFRAHPVGNACLYTHYVR